MRNPNWKTSLGGILATIGMVLAQQENQILNGAGLVIQGIGTLLLGIAAADKSKS